MPKRFLLALVLAGCASTDRDPPPDPAPSDARAHATAPGDARAFEARARELARELILLDGHVDLPFRLSEEMEDVTVRTKDGDFDWPRAVEGGLDAPFLSIYVPSKYEDEGGAKAFADRLIDLCETLAKGAPDKFELARSADDVERIAAAGRIAFLLGMENGSPVEHDLANLDHFHARGVRYITLCHGKDNHICDSSYDEAHTHEGLTEFGRAVVRRMNELGILVDVSHVSDDAFWQVLELSRAPVIASHSSLRHFTPGFERNISDEMVEALAAQGGVVQINFGSTFVKEESRRVDKERRERFKAELADRGVDSESDEARALWRAFSDANPLPLATVADVADHIDRAVALAGVEHVGLGSDFDGVGDTLPIGLEDVSKYPNLLAELLRRGYSEEDLEKICAGNVLRVMRAAERVAKELGAN